MKSWRVAVVGAGCVGSVLARVLRSQGHDVTLLSSSRESVVGRESATPLAALSLERLAAVHGPANLASLARYDRWRRELPHLRRGRFRGFTFFQHVAGLPYASDDRDSGRWLVETSPDDAAATCHWFRGDVDEFLIGCAVHEGVRLVSDLVVERCESDPGADATQRLAGLRRPPHGSAPRAWAESFEVVVIEDRDTPVLADLSPLVPAAGSGSPWWTARYSELPSFTTTAAEDGARFPRGAYPDEAGIVHHLFEEGWMYVLPFDHGGASVGLVLREDRGAPASLRRVLSRYPTLARQFAAGTLEATGDSTGPMRWQREVAAGPRWFLLPQAFAGVEPLYAEGLSWDLRAVERLATVFADASGTGTTAGTSLSQGFAELARIQQAELRHLQRLVAGATLRPFDFDCFVAWSQLPMALASFQAIHERVTDAPPRGAAMQGHLGATDPVACELLDHAEGLMRGGPREQILAELPRILRPRNAMGLEDPCVQRRVCADPLAAVEHAALFGLSAAQMRERLARGQSSR